MNYLEKLIAAVIKSAITEEDWEYFASETFSEHCKVVGLDEELIREKAMRAALEGAKGGK